MRPTPLLSSETKEETRRKLHHLFPEAENEEDEATSVPLQGAEGAEEKFDATNDTLRDIAGGGAGAILDQVESEDDDEIEDRVFKDTDLVFGVSAAGESDSAAGGSTSRLELYTYDELEDNMFIHHDMELAAFPLSTAWLTDGVTSLMAVGTMLPFIEIWALDVMDSVTPLVLLGGCERMEDNYIRKRSKNLKADSHQDAVLTVAWNSVAQNIMVSGSADQTIKLWDLNQLSVNQVTGGDSGSPSANCSSAVCLGTYYEEEKVQSVCFHPRDPNLLLSGGFDGVMRLRDCRTPDQSCHKMTIDGEVVEHVEFVPEISQNGSPLGDGGAGGPPMQVMASTTPGSWACFDTRQTAQPLWQLRPHLGPRGKGEGEVTFSCSLHVPGLFATGGKDGMISLWDGRVAGPGGPQLVVSRNYKTGGVLSMAFHPNSPHILGACGMKGEPLVYTMTEDLQGKW